MSEASLDVSENLIDLASVLFSALTEAEKALLNAAQQGNVAFIKGLILPGPDEGQTEVTRDSLLIRAELIRWMCTDKKAITKVDGRGIKIRGARIKGKLNLSYTNILFPLDLRNCDFPEGIDMESASLGRLNLTGSKVNSIWAIQLVTQGDVSLNQGFHADKSVILNRSRIGGTLDCRGGIFSKSQTVALSVNSAKVEGDVLLSENFFAGGEVNLGSTSIGGNFICAGARIENFEEENSVSSNKGENEPQKKREKNSGFTALRLRTRLFFSKLKRNQIINDTHNEPPVYAKNNKPSKSALKCDQMRVGGSAFLRNGLEIKGETRMIGANINGDLDCGGARLLNPGKNAFVADRIKIGSDAFFNRGFETDGLIILQSATIEGNLSFGGARFIGEKRCGVNLEIATIKRTLIWRHIQKSTEMFLNLDDAHVGRFFDDQNSWPKEGNLSIFGFKYERISGVPTAKLRREWLRRGRRGATLQPYEQLASILKASGHEIEAKKVAISREDVRRRFGGLSLWVRFWKYILKITVGYGYAPRRALLWVAGVVLLGWFIFGIGYQQSLFSPVADGIYRDSSYLSSQTLPEGYQTFNPLVYSVDSFLPIIDLHQESKWLPKPNQKCTILGKEIAGGKYLRIYLWFHIIIGWALTTLTVAGFTGVIRKD
jgi:hypothetical protein